MNAHAPSEFGPPLTQDAEAALGPATPFPRYQRIPGRPAAGGGDLGERESEIPRVESAGELRLRMTRRRLRR